MQMYQSRERKQELESDLRRQQVCIACRQSHLRCSGGPKCIRCQQEGRECRFGLRPGGHAEPATPLQIRTVPGFKASATCVNCRESHLKCTGGTTCARCARSGKLCYYISSRRGQRKKGPEATTHDDLPASNSSLRLSTSPTGSTRPVEQMADAEIHEQSNPVLFRRPPSVGAPEEQRALFFYCENMMPTFIAANTATSEFWGRLVPQASQSEAAIRHMLVACSSWQEMISTSRNSREKSFRLARQHHAKALAVLTQTHAKPSVAVMLTACLLLIVREGAEDPVGDLSDLWIHHTLAGLKILREWRLSHSSEQGPESDIIVNDIEPAFTQIEVVMSMFLPASLTTVPWPGQMRPQLPELFTDHIQMRDTFCEIHRWRYHSPNGQLSDWTDSSPHFKDVHALLKEWHRLILHYLSDMSISFLERRVGAIVWSQYRMLETAFFFSVRDDVPDIERFRPLIINLSQVGKTVIVRNSMTSNLADMSEIRPNQREDVINSLLAASCRPFTASNHESTGLWPIQEVWHGGWPLDAAFVGLHAPGATSTNTDTLGHVWYAKTANIDESASTFVEDKQKQQTDPFEFINVADPNWRTRARSHLTRQQRRAMREVETPVPSTQRSDSDQKLVPARKSTS